MKNNTNIALVQTDLYWEDIKKNLDKFNLIFEKIKQHTDVVVLPEMFSTGFTVNTKGKGKNPGKSEFLWMQHKAALHNLVIVGSVLFEENNRYYNRMFWIKPDGSFAYYDKRHLFQMGNEHLSITAGDRRVVVTHNNIRYLLQVCYDLRFPVASKNRYDAATKEYDYDAIIYVANWPEVRKQAYLNLLKARAIENQAYVIWVNRVGVDHKGHKHTGDSRVIDPEGNLIAKASPGKEEIIYAAINLDALKKIRQNFKVGLDWDSFSIG